MLNKRIKEINHSFNGLLIVLICVLSLASVAIFTIGTKVSILIGVLLGAIPIPVIVYMAYLIIMNVRENRELGE